MKTVFLTITLAFSALFTQAQTAFNYTYDDAGNRDTRNVVHLFQRNNNSVSGMQEDYNESYRVTEELKKGRLSIYPNPFLSEINVELLNTEASVKEVRVYNDKGAVVYRATGLPATFSVSLEGQASGNYHLWLSTSEGIRRFKVIKY